MRLLAQGFGPFLLSSIRNPIVDVELRKRNRKTTKAEDGTGSKGGGGTVVYSYEDDKMHWPVSFFYTDNHGFILTLLQTTPRHRHDLLLHRRLSEIRRAAEPEWSPLLAKTLPHAEAVQPSLLPAKATKAFRRCAPHRSSIFG